MTYKIKNNKKNWIVSDRYEIYKSDGEIIDTKKAKDIPQEVLELRDNLMFMHKQVVAYGSLGGKSTLNKYGKKHFSEAGKKGKEAQKKSYMKIK